MNKHTLAGIAIFAAGVITGSAASMRYFKTKYEKRTQEEIDSVKEILLSEKKQSKEKYEVDMAEKDKVIDDLEKTVSKEVAKDIINYCGYAKTDSVPKYKTGLNELLNKMNGEEEKSMEDKPYVITPEEFGEIDDYDIVTLTYYADGHILDGDEVVTNIEEIIGYDSLEHYGEYEDDTVFVRNDRLMTDYEVCRDERNYVDVFNEQRRISMEMHDE